MKPAMQKLSALAVMICFVATSLYALQFTQSLQASQRDSVVPASVQKQLSSAVPPQVLYNVTFVQNGLPSSLYWYMYLNGIENVAKFSVKQLVFANSISYYVPAGVYNYTVSTYTNTLTSYVPSPQNGSVKVTDSDVVVNIDYGPLPLPQSLFTGAYLNYSIRQQSSSGMDYGYASFGITSVNESSGYYTGYFVRSIASSRYAQMDVTGLGYMWNLPPPLLLIGSSNLLSAYNLGDSSFINVILSQLTNPQSSVTFNNSSFHSGVILSTEIGSFLTDEFSTSYMYSNGTVVPGAYLNAYFDQHSGAMLKYENTLSGNFTEQIQSTDIPMSSNGARLVLHVSSPAPEVSINGIALNLTSGSKTVFVSPGYYYVSISSYGRSPIIKEYHLNAGDTTYSNLTLFRSANTTYSISGHVDPADSSIAVGNFIANTNNTGYYSISLPSGTYTISVAHNGFYPQTRTVTLNHNLGNENFNLVTESPPTFSMVSHGISIEGIGANASNVSLGTGNISLTVNASTNGILTMYVPYHDFSGYSLSSMFHSKVYINDHPYTNFTVAISAVGGTYDLVITVTGVSNDPTLLWTIVASKPVSNTPFWLSLAFIEIVGLVAVVSFALAMSYSLYRRKTR